MASQIRDFEYDIFISYRHNDNRTLAQKKADGWVTEFVDSLSLELEATVKGKVSIYFDENPHDGLLETQNVDESLAPKLKALLFIPIISQTYCDTESFAWKHEFQAFTKIAATDRFGLTVKLLNGNVANRVLPVRIHELDADDISIIEKELKGKLRAIDFIFKSPGVNRPLRAAEDDPLKNANRTLYRDQINKVANAVKDIIQALKHGEKPSKMSGESKPLLDTSIPAVKSKIPGVKSIALLPFTCAGSDNDQEYLGEGLTDELLTMLANIKDLKVINRSLSYPFKSGKLKLREVGEKLGVSSVVEGSVHKTGDRIKINVKLNNTEIGVDLWSEQFDIAWNDIFSCLVKIAYTLAEKLNATIRESERKMVEKVSTPNASAYDMYLKGRYYWNKQGEHLLKSISCFQEAVALDPQFAFAFSGMAKAYVLLGYYNLTPFEEAFTKSKEAALKALQIDSTLTDAFATLAFINMGYEWNWPEAEQYFNKVFAVNPTNPSAPSRYKLYLNQIKNNFDEVGLEPVTMIPHFLQAYSLLHHGQFQEALKVAQKAVERDPQSFMARRAVGLSHLGLEEYDLAIEALLAASRLSNRHSWLLFELMGAYMIGGRYEEGRSIFEEALAQSNALPARIFTNFFPMDKVTKK